MLLDLVNRINSERKVKKNFRHASLSTLKVPQGTSRINLPGTSLERQIQTSPGRDFRTSPGRQIGTSLGRSNRIFRGRPGDVEGGRPRDVLGTSICRLGLYLYFVATSATTLCLVLISHYSFICKKHQINVLVKYIICYSTNTPSIPAGFILRELALITFIIGELDNFKLQSID